MYMEDRNLLKNKLEMLIFLKLLLNSVQSWHITGRWDWINSWTKISNNIKMKTKYANTFNSLVYICAHISRCTTPQVIIPCNEMQLWKHTGTLTGGNIKYIGLHIIFLFIIYQFIIKSRCYIIDTANLHSTSTNLYYNINYFWICATLN